MKKENLFKITSRTRQIAETDLSSSIKEVKSELKQTNKELFSLFYGSGNLWSAITPEMYENKLDKYQSMLFDCRLALAQKEIARELHLSAHGLSFAVTAAIEANSSNHLKQKIALLEQLIKAIELAIETQQLKYSAIVFQLEDQLTQLVDYASLDWITIGPALAKKKKALTETLKKLRSRLRYFVKYKYAKVFRDLRQSFRNLVHFLFKNMSDVSGDDVLLSQVTTHSFFFTRLNYIPHGYARIKKTIRVNT